MFEVDADERALIDQNIAIDPETLRRAWQKTIETTLNEANLVPPEFAWMQTGGRQGRHGEAFGHLLTELQYVQRLIPDAVW